MASDISTALPEGFVPRHEWPEYMPEYDIDPILKPARIHSQKTADARSPQGRRWGRWPLYMEEYISDTEPKIPGITTQNKEKGGKKDQAQDKTRIVRWQRVTRSDVPPGWKQFSKKHSVVEGFAELEQKNKDAFQKNWSESARRAHKKWRSLENQGYVIRPLSYPEFAQAYKKSLVAKRTFGSSIAPTRDRLAAGSADVELWGAFSPQGAVLAGFAALTSPSARASFYLTSFMHKGPTASAAVAGLMQNWHETMASRGVRFLHFGLFWCPGRPRSWKGFSAFKAKFGPTYLAYPPALYRLARKRPR